MPFGQGFGEEVSPYTTAYSRGSQGASLLGAQGGWGSMSSAGPIGAFMAAIAAGKMIEHNNPDSFYGRGLLSLLGPSANQVKEDPKLGAFAAAGVPFLGGLFRNDEAAEAAPEWSKLLGLK